ncbi:MAG: M15 family metallopeptidase [Alistipes sp.]
MAAAQRLLRSAVPDGGSGATPRVRSGQRQMYELVKGTPNQVYVADGTRGGRHNYGVAVDVTLLDETGAPVDMGTPVDFFGDEAHTGNEPALAAEGRISAEASPQPPAARKRDAPSGLVPYRREWWHYEEPMAMSEVRTRYSY